jgi:hypothetical protein
MSDLSARRRKATVAIFAAIGGIGFVSATPTTNLELAKEVFITAANVAMYAVIWDVYFNEDLAQKDVTSILIDLSIITVISAGTAWVMTRAIATLLKDIIVNMGGFGWIVAGIVAGLASGLLGVAWTFYCDDIYRHPK